MAKATLRASLSPLGLARAAISVASLFSRARRPLASCDVWGADELVASAWRFRGAALALLFLPWYKYPMEDIYSAFIGTTRLASGSLEDVLTRVYPQRQAGGLLFFNHKTGAQTDFNLSGSLEEILASVAEPAAKTGPGRPRLGVVSTEVTLLPRHWAWLEAQPGRASGTLRKLVEETMEKEARDPKKRLEVLGKILWALAGNEPGFEEASRALYAGDRESLKRLASHWSGDLPELVATWS
ncbi:MAG: DUF2239 family protein [Spirochaetales bacterium]|nr:DUF2239 family protein [Spirochaetales bacterium]